MMDLRRMLEKNANPEKAEIYQRFFKTGKGEYGEGDIFLGLTVPQTRQIAKQFSHLTFDEIKKHLSSRYHEERLTALLILVNNYQKTKSEKNFEKIRKQSNFSKFSKRSLKEKNKEGGYSNFSEEIMKFYLKNTKYINNWDLVDLTADKILGNYLFDKDKLTLYKLAKSDNLWERRISIISTFYFIKNNQFEDALKMSKILLSDKHDLIHKAVGWMLREIGKRNRKVLENFLKQNYKNIPRTTLRYAIEKFPENLRQKYLRGEI